MKKLLMFVMCSILAVSYTRADDTDQLRVACKSSDKTLWVERNKVCIPRNPCNDSDQNILKYCNRTFADFESRVGTNDYITLINVYAGTHGLDCRAVAQRAKLFGQDYVVCQGTDVMVFEFDDIQDATYDSNVPKSVYYRHYMEALCDAGRGRKLSDGSRCVLSPKLVCDLMKSANIPSEIKLWDHDNNSCDLFVPDEYSRSSKEQMEKQQAIDDAIRYSSF